MTFWNNRILTIFAGAFLLIVTTAQPGSAQVGSPYMSIAGGVIIPNDIDTNVPGVFFENDKVNPGYGINFALGYDLPVGFRVEAELGFNRTNFGDFSGELFSVPFTGDASDIDINIYTFFVNGYYEFNLPASPIVPWVGFGLGMGHIEQEAGTIFENGVPINVGSTSVTEFALNGQVGIDFDLSDSLSLVPSYRFVWIETGDEFTDDFMYHSFWVGLRYAFKPI